MSRQHHYLKILPEYYRAIENGDKTFEVRYNDRNYQQYDILHLQEWVNGVYTKREIDAEVVYLLDNPDYCKEGFVIMGIKVHNVRN